MGYIIVIRAKIGASYEAPALTNSGERNWSALNVRYALKILEYGGNFGIACKIEFLVL